MNDLYTYRFGYLKLAPLGSTAEDTSGEVLNSGSASLYIFKFSLQLDYTNI